MKHYTAFALLLAAWCIAPWELSAQNEKQVVDYVNPLMGTASSFELSTGNTYPAIAMPWGMNFWTPQTGEMGNGWTYTYDAHKIRGFKQTHQPSPWINDYGQFSLMPVTGRPMFDQDERASWFSHKAEEAKPYYYRVYLADHDVTTEMVPTERCALFRFTFPHTEHAYVVVDAFDGGSHVEVVPGENKIVGYTTKNSGGVPDNFKNYFVIYFDKPFEYVASVTDGTIRPDSLAATARHAGAVVGFATRRGEQVHARVASSFISPEQAELNLQREVADRPFDQVKQQGRKRWNDVLGRIQVQTDDVDALRTFYSCLYRSVLFPRAFHETDARGEVMHYSPYNGQVLPGHMFTDTGFWDTFRSLFPLVNLVYPSMGEQMQEGLLNAYLESGFFPEWASPGHRQCMVGNNSASVVADAYLSGVTKADPVKLYEGLLHGANSVHPQISSTGRVGWQQYNKLGYVPCDAGINENVARSLEYAYADWCIYRMGRELGRPKKEWKLYRERSLNYRNLFDSTHNLMRGRRADGTFQEPFNPFKWGDAFTEGNSWHYSWSVFHDVQGLIDLMGGDAAFNAMLDSVFALPPVFDDSYYGIVIHEIREMQIMNMGQYAHGNQPIQHMIYLYNYAGQPWKAQQRVREVMRRLYAPTPDGYCGDEDNGQTSAWYVFSALGFYPVCPGSGEYVMGSPLFPRAEIRLENDHTIEIQADGNAPGSPYIRHMTIDGQPYTKNFLRQADLARGVHIHLHMDSVPCTTRGTAPDDRPYSLSRE